MDSLSDIYFDLKDLRNGHIAECYNNADELLDELIMKFEIYFEEIITMSFKYYDRSYSR